MFQKREIWPFCNVYSEENGPQLGATIQRAKNMHAIYDSRITLKLFYAKNGYKKNITFKKCRVWKAAFCIIFFFCLTPCKFLQFFYFLALLKMVSFLGYWLRSQSLFLFVWNKTKIVQTIIQLVILTLQVFWSSTLKIGDCILAILRY